MRHLRGGRVASMSSVWMVWVCPVSEKRMSIISMNSSMKGRIYPSCSPPSQLGILLALLNWKSNHFLIPDLWMLDVWAYSRLSKQEIVGPKH